VNFLLNVINISSSYCLVCISLQFTCINFVLLVFLQEITIFILVCLFAFYLFLFGTNIIVYDLRSTKRRIHGARDYIVRIAVGDSRV